jgi:hypothetical protein
MKDVEAVLLIGKFGRMEGVAMEATPYGYSQISPFYYSHAISVDVERTYAGLVLTAFPSVGDDMFGWED